MAKAPTLKTVSSGYASNTQLEFNFDAIETAFENTLSLDGSTPNGMTADLDMNSNNITNLSNIAADTLTVGGVIVTDATYVPNWEGPWVTSTLYVVNDLVSEAGSSYICLVAHTSGTFSADLTATKWATFAQQGSAGAGTGDMLAANNLSDVANAATSRSNLGLGDIAVLNLAGTSTYTGTVDVSSATFTLADDQITGAKVAAATLTTEGVVERSTSAENITGTSDTVYPTVAGTKEMIDTHANTSGGLVFISSTDLSSDVTADFTGFNASSYDSYVFTLSNVVPATDGVSLQLRTSTDGGSSYDSGATDYLFSGWQYNTALSAGSGADSFLMTSAVGSAANENGVSGEVTIHGPHIVGKTSINFFGVFTSNTGVPTGRFQGGLRNSVADVDAVRFLFDSGNLESGTITMYGRVNA